MLKMQIDEISCVDNEMPENAVFILRAFDSECATLKVDTLVNEHNWPEISAAIGEAIKQMKLGNNNDSKNSINPGRREAVQMLCLW